MKLLLDTNVLIPLEPATATDLEPDSELAARLWRLAHAAGHTVFLHPASQFDLSRDKNKSRASLRRVLVAKYSMLPDPPPISLKLGEIIGTPDHGSNDWVDNCLVGALHADAVDFLVSQDKGVRAKARRLSIHDRVLTLDEAIRLLDGKASVSAPPAVKAVKVHALPSDDPIFGSFREDYPGFDEWFRKCCREHRQAWKIDGNPGLAGFCIVKDESDGALDVGPRPLKICSFKVAPEYNGFKYGELLLKTLFEHAATRDLTGMFVTVFEKQGALIELLVDFGFQQRPERSSLGELVFAKRLIPTPDVTGLEYHVAFGPPRFDAARPWYIVPIQPRYSDVLFPETAPSRELFEGQFAFGNAIKKAYLCHSGCRRLAAGDILAFYRTTLRQALIAVGIVEDTVVSSDSSTLARAVARRTVYSMQEIQSMCRREVLAIRFRQAFLVKTNNDPSTLLRAKVFSRAPQSVMRAGKEGTRWLNDHFAA